MSDDACLAEEILNAVAKPQQIPLLTARPGGMSIDRAYRLSARIEDMRTQSGEAPVGRKIGFTNRVIWEEYNVSEPIFGPMYDSTLRPLGAPFGTANLLEPRIEPEIAFRLARAPEPGMTPREVMTCVSGVCAGFELVQSLFAGWKFEAADTVAALGLHGAFLHGPFVEVSPVDQADWAAALASFGTTLRCNGTVADEGHARNVLGGGPLVALAHLADLVRRTPHAAPLKAGEIVATGTLTRALPVAPGEVWQARFDGLPLDAIEIALT
ncbi:2-keto-4-pentenoate hydratase [Rhabdonatronobacter sediminivivens]|uniref:2-keto-4-pentenoate hydratase n=1 Tax=Rhabdonatronobacter sediminivivens TaxID=2743469 RepID=UPI002E17F94A